MSNLKYVNDDEEFNAFMKSAGKDVVVLDFYTTWCGPCRAMGPTIDSMTMKYPKVLFLKIDADKCFETAMNHSVKGVPLFVIYMNAVIVDQINGARPQELDEKVRYYEEIHRQNNPSFSNLPDKNTLSQVISSVGKIENVSKYLDAKGCRCINDLIPSSFDGFLAGKKLISGKGSGKLVLVYSFTQKLMLHSFKIKANPETGPKVLRLFANHPKLLDFTVGSHLAPSQEVTLCADDLNGERTIELRTGSFSLVSNLQIFVTQGMSNKSHKIEIESLNIFGAPVEMAKSVKQSTVSFGVGPATSLGLNPPPKLQAETPSSGLSSKNSTRASSNSVVIPVAKSESGQSNHKNRENEHDLVKDATTTLLGISNNVSFKDDRHKNKKQSNTVKQVGTTNTGSSSTNAADARSSATVTLKYVDRGQGSNFVVGLASGADFRRGSGSRGLEEKQSSDKRASPSKSKSPKNKSKKGLRSEWH